MLTAIPTSVFSWNYKVFDADRPVATLSLSWVRERGDVVIGGERYRIGREGWMSGEFSLDRGDERVVSATKPSALRRSFDVCVGSQRYVLCAASMMSRRFVLRDGAREVGTIRPLHWWSRKAEVDLPRDLPLPVQAFLIWLVIILWKRQASNNG